MRAIAVFLGVACVLGVAGCGGGTSFNADTEQSQQSGATVWPPVASAIARVPSIFAATTIRSRDASPRTTATPTSEQLFDWAEQTFPDIFTTHQPTLTDGPWQYRAYFQTGVMLGVNAGNAYLIGGSFGNQLLALGTVSSFPASPVTQAQAFLATLDASFATAVPSTSAAFTELNDGCFLGDGLTKSVTVASFDADPALTIAANKFRIGSTRTDVQVIGDRTTTNSDKSIRRELDLQYATRYLDGTIETDTRSTIIWGSSSGSTMPGGTVCTTPTVAKTWRLYGNRASVAASLRPTNDRNENYSLATGAPSTSAVTYMKSIWFRISDPSKFAQYLVVKGPGLPSTGLKLLSPRILRDDPLLAGKPGNMNWLDTEPFRMCRVANATEFPADQADCVGQGAVSSTLSSLVGTAVATDAAFDARGFVAGGIYKIDVYDDEGWKTVNGQANKTPIDTITRTLNALPYSAVALAGSSALTDLYPHLSTSLSPVQIASVIRGKGSYEQSISWTALGVMPDASKFGALDVYTFIQGSSASWVLARGITPTYVDPKALGIAVYTIPAASSAVLIPNYATLQLQMNNRNGRWVQSSLVFQ